MGDIGTPNSDSLFFSTASAADLMRLADQGRIKEGNSADFVVCDGDPLADIKRAARKENHRLVVKRGIVARHSRAAFVRQATRVAAKDPDARAGRAVTADEALLILRGSAC